MTQHKTDDLIQIFNNCFYKDYRTRLVSGGLEPLYIPATHKGEDHQLIFYQDYYRSALHEVAHWLIAKTERRQQKDYGYWYVPDGRNSTQQAACSGLMEPDTLMRDNSRQPLRCQNERETYIQTIHPEFQGRSSWLDN